MLFKTMYRVAWKESGHNPIQMLSDLPADFLKNLESNAEYLRQYDDVLAKFRGDIEKKVCWFVG